MAPATSTKTKTKSKTSQRQKLVKRACDPCKVRKIKCSEVSPCTGCIASGIECTFHQHQATRGPRTLRARTIDRIAKTRHVENLSDESDSPEQDGAHHLIELLNIYAERLYPIWPIVDAALVSGALVLDPHNERTQHLAHAVALATIAQLKLNTPWKGCVQKIERDAREDSMDLLDSLRVSFFLHIYYENQMAGGTKSLLYLREAITKAQLLRIDREATYASLPEQEQQLLRRILWLLFVTERGVAMLHKLPVVLRPNTIFPWFGGSTNDTGQHVMPAFLRLVHLFWTFDQSGIFELLRNADTDVSSMESLARGCVDLLQRRLQDTIAFGEDSDGSGNDVQRADMLVTRQWMRAVLWRAALRFGVVVPGINPVDVAGEFLALVGKLPTTALESQGPTLEFKTYEIATAVVDAVSDNYDTNTMITMSRPQDVLQGLYGILSSSRGGNETLLALLNSKMAAVRPDLRLLVDPSTMPPSQSILTTAMPHQNDEWDWSTSSVMGDILDQYDMDQMAQLAWPPLDLGNLLRSPSPLTRMLLDQPQGDHRLE